MIKQIALDAGFSAAGISDLCDLDESNRVFSSWLEQGKHADMHYLLKKRGVRENPRRLLPAAQSVICVALNYYVEPPVGEASQSAGGPKGIFSIYSRRGDYHKIMGEMLEQLALRLKDVFHGMKAITSVDSKPVPERTLAMKAGIGWLGKNTCVISPRFGSWIFLGEIITDLKLDSDRPLQSLCSTCERCMEACPTGALEEPYVLDSTRCISYLTIEKRGSIPEEIHPGLGIHVFGCDICQQVCPFNSMAEESSIFRNKPENELANRDLEELAAIGEEEFLSLTKDSVIRRCKAEGMRRNAEIALMNFRRKGPAEL